MRAYANRYAFTDFGPAMIWTHEKMSATKARKLFARHGMTVERFVPNWAHFLGWAHVIEIHVDSSASTSTAELTWGSRVSPSAA